MGRKKLNFSRTDFKKSDAQSAGFTTKGAALKFFKSTPKNKLDNFKSVNELVCSHDGGYGESVSRF